MKRTLPFSPEKKVAKAKKAKIEVPEYHLAPSARDERGEIIWPAPASQIERARIFMLQWFVPYISPALSTICREAIESEYPTLT